MFLGVNETWMLCLCFVPLSLKGFVFSPSLTSAVFSPAEAKEGELPGELLKNLDDPPENPCASALVRRSN